MSEGIISARTTFLSKLIGFYLMLISLAMIAHKQATVESMNALVHNAPVLFVVGVIAVAAGLAMVLGHNVKIWPCGGSHRKMHDEPVPLLNQGKEWSLDAAQDWY